MKTYLTKSKSNFFFLALLLASPVWAKPVAQVTAVNGGVFVVTPEGKTKSLKLNDHLDEKSEIMVEEGGNVTLNDYFDATYHLIGGSHMKLFSKSVQLKRGKTWIQAKNGSHELALTTANGLVEYGKSEFITTFDQATSRSQILVVNGDVEVSNILDKNMKYSVPAGSFTLVDPEVENGVPRSPTKVGLASLNTSLAEFKKLPENMIEATKPQRSIASVEEAPAAASQVKKGEITFITTSRMPASVGGSARDYFVKRVKKNRTISELTTAPIKFYGVGAPVNTAQLEAPKAIISSPAPRSPASVPVQPKMPQKAVESIKIDPEFSESLKGLEKEQPKHSKELESLIHDLKSY